MVNAIEVDLLFASLELNITVSSLEFLRVTKVDVMPLSNFSTVFEGLVNIGVTLSIQVLV